jgi:hypothetical protein
VPPWSVAALLAGLFPGTSFVPATFLEWVPSLKLIWFFPTNEQSHALVPLRSSYAGPKRNSEIGERRPRKCWQSVPVVSRIGSGISGCDAFKNPHPWHGYRS